MVKIVYQPVASPVELLKSPTPIGVAKPAEGNSLSDLAKTLGVIADLGEQTRGYLKEKGQTEGERLYLENKKTWSAYTEKNSDKKYLNPYIQDGYNRAKAKAEVYGILTNFKEKQSSMAAMSPEEFDTQFTQKINEYIDKQRQEGVSNQAINEVIPQINAFRQQLSVEHAYKHGEYVFGQLKATVADDLNKKLATIDTSTNDLVQRTGFYNQALDTAIRTIRDGGGTVEDGIGTVLEGIESKLYNTPDLEEKDMALLKNTIASLKIDDKDISSYVPDINQRVGKMVQNYEDAQLAAFVKTEKMKEYHKKEVMSNIEKSIYATLTDVEQATPENLTALRKKILVEATRADVLEEVGTINGFLLDHVKTLRGLAKNDVQSDMNTLMNVHNKVLTNRINYIDIMKLSKDGKISQQDAIEEMSKLRSIKEDDEAEAKSLAKEGKGKTRYQQLRSYTNLGNALIDELKASNEYNYNPNYKNTINRLDARYSQNIYLEDIGGGNGAGSYQQLQKAIEALNQANAVKKAKSKVTSEKNLPKFNFKQAPKKQNWGLNNIFSLPSVPSVPKNSENKPQPKPTRLPDVVGVNA
jgi:hypothetical protein